MGLSLDKNIWNWKTRALFHRKLETTTCFWEEGWHERGNSCICYASLWWWETVVPEGSRINLGHNEWRCISSHCSKLIWLERAPVKHLKSFTHYTNEMRRHVPNCLRYEWKRIDYKNQNPKARWWIQTTSSSPVSQEFRPGFTGWVFCSTRDWAHSLHRFQLVAPMGWVRWKGPRNFHIHV